MTAHERAKQYPYTVPATRFYNVWSEPTHRSFVRKAGSDFGWDWGPAFVPIGIYQTISSQQCPTGRLDGLLVHQRELVISSSNDARSTASSSSTAEAGIETETAGPAQDKASTGERRHERITPTTTSSVILDVSIRLSGVLRRVETYASVYLNDEFQFNTKFIISEDGRTVRYQRSTTGTTSSASSTGKTVPRQRAEDTTTTDAKRKAQREDSSSSGDRDDHCSATPTIVTVELHPNARFYICCNDTPSRTL